MLRKNIIAQNEHTIPEKYLLHWEIKYIIYFILNKIP